MPRQMYLCPRIMGLLLLQFCLSTECVKVSPNKCSSGSVTFPAGSAGTMSCTSNVCKGCTVNCAAGQTCTVKCTNMESCMNMKLNCPKGARCNVECQGTRACQSAIIKGATGGALKVTCGDNESCKKMDVTSASSASPVTVTCSSNYACSEGKLKCRGTSACNVKCTSQNSCKHFDITLGNGDLDLLCDADHACSLQTVSRPSGSGETNIDCHASHSCNTQTVSAGGPSTLRRNCRESDSCSGSSADCSKSSATTCYTTCGGTNSCGGSNLKCHSRAKTCAVDCTVDNSCTGFGTATNAKPVWCRTNNACSSQLKAKSGGLKSTSVPATSVPVPRTSAPDTLVPSTRAPRTPSPATSVPATTAPATGAPTTLVPKTPAPDTRAPATSAPSTSAPSTGAPLTPVPDTRAPDTPLPLGSTYAPKTLAPDTDAPSTPAPLTPAPKTQVPETNAPPTTAPATSVPSTSAPMTAAPPTSVPTALPAGSTLPPVTPAPQTGAPSTSVPRTESPSTPSPPGTTLPPDTLVPLATTLSPPTLAPGTLPPATPAPQTMTPATGIPVSPSARPTQAPVVAASTPPALKSETKQELTKANSFASATSLLAGGGAGTAARMALLKDFGCEVDDVDLSEVENLDWEFHPTRIAFSGSKKKYMQAAVVMNIVIILGFGAMLLLLAALIKHTFSVKWAEALGDVRAPGLLYIPYLFLLQGTSLVAAKLAFFPSSAVDAILGWGVLLFCAASPAVMATFLRNLKDKALVLPDARLFPMNSQLKQLYLQCNLKMPTPIVGVKRFMYKVFLGDSIWVPSEGDYICEQLGAIFEGYKEDKVWMVVGEPVVMVLLSLLSAWKPASASDCTGRNTLITSLLGSWCFALLITRPYIAIADNVIACALAAFTFMAVLFMTVAIAHRADPDTVLFSIAGQLLFLSAILLTVKSVFDIAMYATDIWLGRRKEARKSARGREPESPVEMHEHTVHHKSEISTAYTAMTDSEGTPELRFL